MLFTDLLNDLMNFEEVIFHIWQVLLTEIEGKDSEHVFFVLLLLLAMPQNKLLLYIGVYIRYRKIPFSFCYIFWLHKNNCIPFGIIENRSLCYVDHFTGLHLECESLPVFEDKVFPLVLTAYFGELLPVDDYIGILVDNDPHILAFKNGVFRRVLIRPVEWQEYLPTWGIVLLFIQHLELKRGTICNIIIGWHFGIIKLIIRLNLCLSKRIALLKLDIF